MGKLSFCLLRSRDAQVAMVRLECRSFDFCCRDGAVGTERGGKLRFKPPIEAVNLPRLHLDGVVEANGARLAGADGDGLSVLCVARKRTRL